MALLERLTSFDGLLNKCILTILSLIVTIVSVYYSKILIITTFATITLLFWQFDKIFKCIINQNQPLTYDLDYETSLASLETAKKITAVLMTKLAKTQASRNVKLLKMKVQHRKIKSFDPLVNTVDNNVICLNDKLTQKFVQSWYVSQVSENPRFLDEAKVLLEPVIKRILLLLPLLDYEKIFAKWLVVFLNHIKEFRRAQANANGLPVEEVYRYVYPNNRNDDNFHKHLNKLTEKTLLGFIPYELWDSIPCDLMIAVITQLFTLPLVKYFVDPDLLLANVCAVLSNKTIGDSRDDAVDGAMKNGTNKNEVIASNANVEEKPVEIVTVHHERPAAIFLTPKKKQNDAKRKHSKSDVHSNAPLLSNCDNVNWSHFSSKEDETLVIETMEEVKEYVPLSTTPQPTTWTGDDYDLIQIGQDLLASEITTLGKRLWNFSGDSEMDTSPQSRDENPLIVLDDEKTFSNIAMQNVKDLHSKSLNTVSDAMNKIGDIQDEAAGYVEGILDFGLSGFKKGLRLTGLQDSINLSPPMSKTANTSPYDHRVIDTTLINSHSTNKLEAMDNKSKFTKGKKDSPEYEDTADFATTIAKLRQLLQQKSSGESTTSSPISPVNPIDMTCEALGDNSLLKSENFLSRTVTGMFNTIKTALPAHMMDITNATHAPLINPMSQRWMFYERDVEVNDLIQLIDQFYKERNELNQHVDDAVDALDGIQNDPLDKRLNNHRNFQFADNFDECFCNIPISYLLMDIVCELAHDSQMFQEPIVKMLLVVFGDIVENIFRNLTKLIFKKLENIDSVVCEFFDGGFTSTPPKINQHDAINLLRSQYIPAAVEAMLGRENLENGLKLLLESFQYTSVNRDVGVQLLEVFFASVVARNKELSPKASTAAL